MKAARRLSATAVALVLGVACTSGSSSSAPVPPPAGFVTGSSAVQAMERLCVRPAGPKTTPPTAPPPAAIVNVEHEVEAVRQLPFVHPVAVAPLTHQELARRILTFFDHSFPTDQMARRSLAWQTIGVIAPGTDLEAAFKTYFTTEVIGFYDPDSGELAFIGTNAPNAIDRFTLAHELTHADDDQHFHLERVDALENRCQDETELAATGAIEGSAVFFSSSVVRQFFTPQEIHQIESQHIPPPTGIPPFIQALEAWPYIAGPRFIAAELQQGGIAAVDTALTNFPVSTEQVMHPAKYPGDTPVPVDVPDLAPKLGPTWHDLDVMQVGEAWLDLMLKMHLTAAEADPAAAGWGGGIYRAWTDGTHVAVTMATRWDSAGDATQFAGAVRHYLTTQNASVHAFAGSKLVIVDFASDPATLRTLDAALFGSRS